MQVPDFQFDGNWVDIGSLVTGAAFAVYRRIRNRPPSRIVSKQTGINFANGAAMFPLMIMAVSVTSSAFIKGLVEASKMSLSVAGLFALLAILEEKDERDGVD
jgi:hypothetical protein